MQTFLLAYLTAKVSLVFNALLPINVLFFLKQNPYDDYNPLVETV